MAGDARHHRGRRSTASPRRQRTRTHRCARRDRARRPRLLRAPAPRSCTTTSTVFAAPGDVAAERYLDGWRPILEREARRAPLPHRQRRARRAVELRPHRAARRIRAAPHQPVRPRLGEPRRPRRRRPPGRRLVYPNSFDDIRFELASVHGVRPRAQPVDLRARVPARRPRLVACRAAAGGGHDQALLRRRAPATWAARGAAPSFGLPADRGRARRLPRSARGLRPALVRGRAGRRRARRRTSPGSSSSGAGTCASGSRTTPATRTPTNEELVGGGRGPVRTDVGAAGRASCDDAAAVLGLPQPAPGPALMRFHQAVAFLETEQLLELCRARATPRVRGHVRLRPPLLPAGARVAVHVLAVRGRVADLVARDRLARHVVPRSRRWPR